MEFTESNPSMLGTIVTLIGCADSSEEVKSVVSNAAARVLR
jgi:hypothetical protein